jgi:hypothetical protein
VSLPCEKIWDLVPFWGSKQDIFLLALHWKLSRSPDSSKNSKNEAAEAPDWDSEPHGSQYGATTEAALGLIAQHRVSSQAKKKKFDVKTN